jgi:hypothetical protein
MKDVRRFRPASSIPEILIERGDDRACQMLTYGALLGFAQSCSLRDRVHGRVRGRVPRYRERALLRRVSARRPIRASGRLVHGYDRRRGRERDQRCLMRDQESRR